MVNILYAVTAFVCSLVLIILTLRMRRNLNKDNPIDRTFLFLITWTAAFCMIDCIWGVLASELIMNSTLLFIFSTVFHICAAFTPLVWLKYVLVYLGGSKHEKTYLAVFGFVFLAQLVLLGINVFTRMMFYIDDTGVYCSTSVRRLLFYMQYITYVLIAVVSSVKYFRSSHEVQSPGRPGKISRNSYRYVIMFVAAPIFTGIFQMIYPDAPAYSIGYMLGCCIIYSFAVADMLNERMIGKAVADASNKAKTDFLFNMSHDIRTPMNAIRGFTAMAKKNAGDGKKVSEYLNKIDVSCQQLLTLINQVLEMARIESGKIDLKENSVSIRDEFTSMVTVLNEQAKEKGLEFRYSLENIEHNYIFANEARMSSITMNVAGNAIKYTPEGGTIDFILKEIPGSKEGFVTLVFIVSDNGIGMSPEYLKEIYTPFSREKSSTVSKIQGTGLGLAIVKNAVDLMDGTIEVQSEPGKGTRFEISLDFKIDTEGEDNSTEDNKEGIEMVSFSGRRVLLVEDNEMNREIARDILEEQGLVVEDAEDGDVAVRMVQEIADRGDFSYYDFILMDVQMPRMNGYEATKAIRAIPCPSGVHIPIIAMTANAFEEDRRNAISAGMDDHLSKPIDVQIMFRTIAKFLK